MDTTVLYPGLWRWTAGHPEWQPGARPGTSADWPQAVGCVLYETPTAAVFIDPLVPADGEAFWQFADARVEACGGARVLVTIQWHERSQAQVAARYGASAEPPPQVVPVPIAGADETMYWLPDAAALLPGDRLIDLGAGLQVCPDSWLEYLGTGLTQAGLRAALAPLADLPVERIVLSHGDPVLSGGGEALRRVLAG